MLLNEPRWSARKRLLLLSLSTIVIAILVVLIMDGSRWAEKEKVGVATSGPQPTRDVARGVSSFDRGLEVVVMVQRMNRDDSFPWPESGFAIGRAVIRCFPAPLSAAQRPPCGSAATNLPIVTDKTGIAILRFPGYQGSLPLGTNLRIMISEQEGDMSQSLLVYGYTSRYWKAYLLLPRLTTIY